MPCSTMRPLSMTTIRSLSSMVDEAVGDDERGAAAGEAVEGAADQRLALGVERGGRLVEEQDRRVAQDGAGDREALALAAGELAGGRARPGCRSPAAARG